MHIRHKWEAVAVQPMLEWSTCHGVRVTAPGDETPITKVLSRCWCGKVKSQTLEGRWTLFQIRGEIS